MNHSPSFCDVHIPAAVVSHGLTDVGSRSGVIVCLSRGRAWRQKGVDEIGPGLF